MRRWRFAEEKTNRGDSEGVEPEAERVFRPVEWSLMGQSRQRLEDRLLDFHLNQLQGDDRAQMEADLLRDAELRHQSDRLGQLLRPLDHWTVATEPAGLADRILSQARRRSSSPTIAPAPETGYRPRLSLNLREVLAVAASIALLATLAYPLLSSVREQSQQARCVSSLGSVFRGTSLYRQAFDGSLPYAGYVHNASWLPNETPGRPYASNNRHVYLVAKLNYATPMDFICPTSKACSPMPADELARHNDFASARNISYDSINLSGERPNLRPLPDMAYMSDPNPLFVGGKFQPSIDPTRANSPAHGGTGQTVLFIDGSAMTMTSPIYGSNKDNLWLVDDIRQYTGTESATNPHDAFLIPGYPSTDLPGHPAPAN